MKILIAGGAGYIGSVLVPKLIRRGYDVEVIDLLWFGNNLPESVSVIENDIIKLNDENLVGYDQVIFLAGLSNDPMAIYSPAMNFVGNGSVPAFLAYISKRAGVKRFIYGSSCSVYGYTVNELYDEKSPTSAHYAYGISKLQGESASLQLHDEKFSVISLRQGTVSGYSPRMRLDLVVNTMFMSAVSDGVIQVDNPAIWRPVLAIQDAVAGYIRAIEATDNLSGIFNIASDNFTIGEVADYVKNAVKKYMDIDTEIQIQHIEDYRNYKVSTKKIANVLSFKPMNNIDSIVRELAENLDKFKDFQNDNYFNIKVFKKLFPEK
jgi:nucleoside-diphosphate-sugar epimerase